MFTLELLEFLQSPQAINSLKSLHEDTLKSAQQLATVTRLRKTFNLEESAVLLETAQLRLKAHTKFGEVASQMFFTADALEQATDSLVAQYHAQRLSDAGFIVDACCSVGTDALTLAQHGKRVLGLDIDPIRVRMAQLNAQAMGITNAEFRVADVTQFELPIECDTVFFDPARRDEQGKRIYHVEQYSPPLSCVQRWGQRRIFVKLSPGVALSDVSDYGGELNFVSVKGNLKEALLCLNQAFQGTSATILAEQTLTFYKSHDTIDPDISFAEPHGWLCEPDAAIMRAGLVRDWVKRCEGTMLDETIAYFCADQPQHITLGIDHCLKISQWLPFNIKHLRAILREKNIGNVTVKKRGSPITPEELTAQLKLKGQYHAVLVLTRYLGNPIVIICEA
jgi:THUMP domain-like/Methyltransferase domain